MHYLYFICERKFYPRKNYPTLEINPKVTLVVLVVAHLSSGIVERAKRERACNSPHARKDDTPLLSPHRVSPILAWGDLHERSRFGLCTVPEEKWGTTRRLPLRK